VFCYLNDDIVLAIAIDPAGWFFTEDAANDDADDSLVLEDVNPLKVNTYDGLLLLLLLLACVGVFTVLSALTTLLLFLVDNELPIAVGLFFY